jgi:hypothetical protein
LVNLKSMSLMRPPKPGVETAAALAGTAFSAILLVLTAMYAGPLWRDEVNTLNLAQMPSWADFWNNLAFESFPPLWPLLLRGCHFLGLADSDAGIRVLGLYVGLCFLVSLWLCARWMGGRAPILSLALLGSLPTFIFIAGSNRAYGLAGCLLVLSFGMIWRMLEFPSKARVLWCGSVCVLFAHCVYYDVLFLGAMLAGAAVVVIRRRQWKTLASLAGIGIASGASLLIYLPVVHRGSAYASMMQLPFFSSSTLWYKLGLALTARSSAHFDGPVGPEIWLWVVLLLGGIVAAFIAQSSRERQPQKHEAATMKAVPAHADLALFCVVSMLLGIAGDWAFLLKLHYLTQTWYYIGMLVLCAISLDGMLNVNWPALRPPGLLRIGFMVLMMSWSAGSAWKEAHTRRSNVDLIAAVLSQKASAGDLIVVQSAWEGITFNRYYHGRVSWVTVPPVDSHQVHRTDLVMDKMNQPDAMAPVLRGITDTLRDGHQVWVVGSRATLRPKLPPPPAPPAKLWSSYLNYWSAQLAICLQDHALQEEALEIPAAQPVCHLENLPLLRFSGYKSGAE